MQAKLKTALVYSERVRRVRFGACLYCPGLMGGALSGIGVLSEIGVLSGIGVLSEIGALSDTGRE